MSSEVRSIIRGTRGAGRGLPARALALLLIGSTLTACLRWRPEWRPARTADAALRAGMGEADADLARAREASERAVDAVGLRNAMADYEKVLAAEPQNYAALVALADHSILMATAYTEERAAKRALYRRAMRLAERAMYTNSEFRRRADGGARPWEASGALDRREMGAMMAWMTALLYTFKECMSGPVRVINVRWITRLDPMLDRMEQLDERWADGAVPFTRAFYYFVLPPSLGGDRKLAARSFERAVEMGPNRLLHRWGRARFFHDLTSDRDGFVSDLEWVSTRDPDAFTDAPPWKAYIQRDAKRLLGEADCLFGSRPKRWM